MSTAPVLELDNVTIALPSAADRPFALRDLSLAIASGRTLCVVGESGSGKSMTASAIMGLLPKSVALTSGQIRLGGEDLGQASDARWRALRGAAMGMVFQEPMTALNPIMPCGRQIEELLEQHTSLSRSERRVAILDMLAKVQLADPARIYRSYPHQLSGGQRQRVVIAMALILKPALLICDEPTTALDVTTQASILKLIKQMQLDFGQAVLMITHDMGVVAEFADDVLVLHQGETVEYGPRDQVLHAPQHDYTKMLLSAVPSLTPRTQRPPAEGAETLIARGVAKTYRTRDWFGRWRETRALHNASMAVRAGETVGIIGESGSGKSTLARCLIRLIDPTSGALHWGDHEVQQLPERRLRPLRSHIQLVFQDPNRSLNPRRTVGQSIIEAAMNFGISRQEAKRDAERLMEQVKLPIASLDRYPSAFSGGQRQRIAIARALACRPSVLIADEAVSALDVSVQARVIALLKDIQQEIGLSIIFITHDLRVAAQLCDRVIVMRGGEVVEEGPVAPLYRNPQHDYTRALLSASPTFEYRG